MLLYKKTDLYVQMVLLFSLVIYAIFFRDPNLIYFYLGLGGWQLLSCLIHGLSSNYYPEKYRKSYLLGLLIVLLVGIVMTTNLIIFGFLLLIFSPVLAVWYIVICYREVEMLRERKQFQLK